MTRQVPFRGLQYSISFQSGVGRGFAASPVSLTTEWRYPRTNMAVMSLSSTLASLVPKQVVFPTFRRLSVTNWEKLKKQQTSSPTNVTESGVLHFWPSGVEFPWIRIQLRVQMDVAERVYNVSSCRDPFLVNVEFWPNIASHRRVRLSNACRLFDDGIKNGRFRFPDIEGYARQLSGKRRHSCGLWVEL